MISYCYDGGLMVIFPLFHYLSACSSFFSFLLVGNCPLSESLNVWVSGSGVYVDDNLLCFVPVGRLSFSGCVLVFNPLIPPCP